MKRKCNGEGTIFKRKDGRWSAQAYVTLTDGTRKRISITKPEREAVKAKLDEVMAQEKKKIPFAEKSWTVAAYLEHWLKHTVKTRTRPNTFARYESVVRTHIIPTLGNKRLNELGVRDVQCAIEKLKLKGCGGRTMQIYRQVLSSALNRAMRDELLFRNVARLVDLPKYEKKEVVIWTAKQAALFLQTAQADRWYVGYLMMLTYGIRRGEMAGLRWCDIDFENDCFHIRQQINRIDGKLCAGAVKTKAGRRTLPLVSAVRAALLERARSSGIAPVCFDPNAQTGTVNTILVTQSSTAIEPKALQTNFSRLIEQAGLPKITLHATRHIAATLLKNLNVPLKDVQLILGHANVSTTLEIYQHGDMEIHRQAISAVEHVLHTDKAAAVRDNCCQKLLSNRWQADGAIQNNRGGGLDFNAFLTQQPQAYELVRGILKLLPTPVILQLQTHATTQILGAVAVKTAVKIAGEKYVFPRAAGNAMLLRRVCKDQLKTRDGNIRRILL